MLDLREVFSLTDFLRNHKGHVARLAQTGKPVVLTVKGKPALVLQSAEGYQDLVDLIETVRGKNVENTAARNNGEGK
jgi:prevent-host-death family protein